MVNINTISEVEEQEIVQFYQEYRKSELRKQPNQNLLDKINSIFKKLFEL